MIESTKRTIAIVCNSNLFVPYVLSEILTHNKEQYLILSDIDNIERFFYEACPDNAVTLRYYQPVGKRIWESRRKLIESTDKYNICKIIFFHAEFGGIINWFLLRKSKSVDICYCKVFNKQPFPKAHGFKALKCWIFNWLLNGASMDILINNDQMFPSLPDSFFKKIKSSPYKVNVNDDIINAFLSNKLKFVNNSARILLLTGSSVAAGYVEESEYTSKTDALIEAIGKDHIVSKCHPRFSDVFGKEKELVEVPSYIPGNLIINYYDVCIGNHSTMLIEAAIAGKIAISLLNYYYQENKQKAALKTFFDDRLQGRAKIYYPTTITEVLNLISSRLKV